MNVYDIIIRPIITERSNMLAGELNQFTFEVHLDSNKPQIKAAVEQLFDVEVVSVRTLIVPAKRGRRGRKVYMRTGAYKKAIITLPVGQTIPLFNV